MSIAGKRADVRQELSVALGDCSTLGLGEETHSLQLPTLIEKLLCSADVLGLPTTWAPRAAAH
jgi:hypothetical protein